MKTQLLVLGILICSSLKYVECCQMRPTCRQCNGQGRNLGDSGVVGGVDSVTSEAENNVVGQAFAFPAVREYLARAFPTVPRSKFESGTYFGNGRLFNIPCCEERNNVNVAVNVNVCEETENCKDAATVEMLAVQAAEGKENEIDFVVQTPEANHVGDAIITYVDSGEIKTLITDKDGKATGKVTGCEVAVQVSADLYQPMQRMLDCCNNPLPTVVLELRPMCNFQVWFTAHEGDGFVYDDQYIDSLSYMYSTGSGGSGFGKVSVGEDTAPVCIHVNANEASETLKFRVVGQGANSVNELVMSHFDKSDEYNSGVFAYGARMVLPAAVYEYDADDMFFTLYMNTWEEQEFDVEHNEYDSVYVYTSDGTEIDSNDPYDDFYMTYSKSAVEDEGKVGEDLLIGFDMYPDDSNIRFYGNAALSDTDGNVTSAEAPSRSDWSDGGIDDWFPFCMCRGDTKEVKLVSTEYSVLEDFDPSSGNVCHFYLLCPCPMHDHNAEDHSSLENECSSTDLEEFFCGTSAYCEGCAPPSEITNWSLADCPM